MTIWKSETTSLESKRQLQEHRKHYWKRLLVQNELDLDLYHWWTQASKDFERTLWTDADTSYEGKKSTLKTEIKKLAKEEKKQYFRDIKIDENTNEDTWL